jgi:DNA-binding response OmpR family regulator
MTMARILVVEDDEQVRTMLCMTLDWAGYDAHGAPDGNVAIRMQRERPADLVVTDLIMPDKEGLEMIMDLRREWPRTKIIAISGGGRVGPGNYLSQALHLGAARAISKPFGREELLGAIRELLGEA